MARQKYYKYNPVTDNYERIYPTLRSRLASLGKLLLASSAIALCMWLAAWYLLSSPNEESLRDENSALKQKYSLLQKRLDYAMKILDGIEKRDDNFYRVMLQMEPVSRSRRYAGFDNPDLYSTIQSLSDAALADRIGRDIDLLNHKLYTQSKSFDDLKEAAAGQQKKLAHIPSILPLNVSDLSIASGFGMRKDPVYGSSKFHEGIDLAAAEGTPVFAPANGIVKFTGWKGSLGNSIEIDHGYNYITRFGSLSEITVAEGQQVRRGEIIGRVGSSGKSTGPHVHYEVRFKDEPQNPINYYFMDLTPAQYEEMIEFAENAARVMD